MFTVRNYVRAQSLEEAYELNQKRMNRVIGGMLFLKTGKFSVDTAIDLCDLDLAGIKETADRFEIGAMTSLHELEIHRGLSGYSSGAVKEALKDIVGVQFRNLATVGGSLYGRYGFSDVLTLFMAMDSYVELYHRGIVPLSQFAYEKPDRDILVKLIIRKTPGRFSYRAVRASKTDLPILNCACSILENKIHTVIGARPGRAMEIPDEYSLLKDGLTEESIRDFAAFCSKAGQYGSNMRGSAAYRAHLADVLVTENLTELGGY